MIKLCYTNDIVFNITSANRIIVHTYNTTLSTTYEQSVRQLDLTIKWCNLSVSTSQWCGHGNQLSYVTAMLFYFSKQLSVGL